MSRPRWRVETSSWVGIFPGEREVSGVSTSRLHTDDHRRPSRTCHITAGDDLSHSACFFNLFAADAFSTKCPNYIKRKVNNNVLGLEHASFIRKPADCISSIKYVTHTNTKHGRNFPWLTIGLVVDFHYTCGIFP